MSRAAVYDALLADSRLVGVPPSGLGLDQDSIKVNYDSDQRPSDEIFIILGWGDTDIAIRGDDTFTRGFRNLTVWVHMYVEFSTDLNRLDDILLILDDIFDNMIDIAGADNRIVSLVEKTGKSRDMRDDVYQTLCRSATYRVLSREAATV